MPHIDLTAEQSQLIAGAAETVEVRLQDGRVITRIAPSWTLEEIAEIKRRVQNEPCYSGEQVREYLKLLENETAEKGVCDQERAGELLSQLTPAR